MGDVDQAELDRRASDIAEHYKGIWAPFEAFYVRSVLYSATRACDAFLRFEVAKTVRDTADSQVSCVHEALGHAAALSRFFWPSGLGARRTEAMQRLTNVRAQTLREAFSLDDRSPLKDRKLRDALEHFDERLDKYLLALDAGHVFPDPLVGDLEDVTAITKVFKMLDPNQMCLVLLGEPHFFGDLRREVKRIHDLALAMDRHGGRLWLEGMQSDPNT